MKVLKRDEIEQKYKWDLTHIFKTEQELEDAITKYKEYYNFYDEFYEFYYNLNNFDLEYIAKETEKQSIRSEEYEKLFIEIHTYANLQFDQDTSISKSSELKDRISLIMNDVNSKFSFVNVKMAELPLETLEYLRDYDHKNERLNKRNKISYQNLIDRKKHILSDKEEKILSELSSASLEEVRDLLCYSDIKYGKVILESGEEIELNDTTYQFYMKSDNRNDRKLIYETFWTSYKQYQNTFSKLIYENILDFVKVMKLKNYNTSLEATLLPNLPTEIYHSLIKYTRDNIHLYHNYLKLRKKQLGVDVLEIYDFKNSIVSGVKFDCDIEKAKKLILEANEKYLGIEIKNIIQEAFENNWIDFYNTENKASGAYMNGNSLQHPYILTNYKNDYDGISTLSHELGHALHSYLSTNEQDFQDRNYSLFIAEIASITNEKVLLNYLLEKETDESKKLYLMNEFVSDFVGTVYRQVMFAEFELWMYEEVEKGEILTSEYLNNKYLELSKFYYGHEQGITNVDDLSGIVWAYIPHFYFNFYVFKYATSFVGSLIAFNKIKDGITEPFIKLLKSGGSDRPLNLLKKAEIDLTSKESYDKAFEMFGNYVEYLNKNL
jgi:oligoendopeptidase F